MYWSAGAAPMSPKVWSIALTRLVPVEPEGAECAECADEHCQNVDTNPVFVSFTLVAIFTKH